MYAQRLLVCLAIALIAVIATQGVSISSSDNYVSSKSNKSHDLIIGDRESGDRLVLKQNVIDRSNSSWMQVTLVQMTFNTSRTWEQITQVKALDQNINGTGGYIRFSSGGPGYNYVTLKFMAPRGHSINYIVELYAR